MITTVTKEEEYLTQAADVEISQRILTKGIFSSKNGKSHWRKATAEEIAAVRAYQKEQEEKMKSGALPDEEPNP